MAMQRPNVVLAQLGSTPELCHWPGGETGARSGPPGAAIHGRDQEAAYYAAPLARSVICQRSVPERPRMCH